MSDIIKKYPKDVMGDNPNNVILGEPHTLVEAVAGRYRVLVPNYGGFFTRSLVVRDKNGVELIPHVDYLATYLYQEATVESGLEVCGAVVIINPNVSSDVFVDYHVIGGDLAFSVTTLQSLLLSLSDENRPVEWAGIIGKPDYYPPGGHLHALWELYGFEYMVIQLERITQAILTGNQATMDELRAYAKALYEDGKDYTDALDARFQLHLADDTNPHRVTKAQVGLGSVPNYPMASLDEAFAGDRSDRFMSPAGVSRLLEKHSASGDHDGRYVRINSSENGSLRVQSGQLQAYVNGTWKVIWPAQWV